MPAIVTRQSLAADLRRIGVAEGDTICLHVSMKSLGLVIGAQRTIVEAMLDALGQGGTLMMPTFSGDNSDPAAWRCPAVPPHRVKEIEAATPAYDRDITPARGVGTVAEYFRRYPGTIRSGHPQSSFAALGPRAGLLTMSPPPVLGESQADMRFGPASPLGRLVKLKGKVLLLGAPRDTASLFHLTQHYMPGKRFEKRKAKINGGWLRYDDIEYPCGWFCNGMGALVSAGVATVDRIGDAETVLFGAAEAVKFLVAWRLDMDSFYENELAGADMGHDARYA